MTAFESHVMAYIVSWCERATKVEMDRLADRFRENCSRAQRARLAAVFQAMAARLAG